MKPLNEQIKEIIALAVGQGSMCWDDVEKAGAFDSAKAATLVDSAAAEIANAIYESKRTESTN